MNKHEHGISLMRAKTILEVYGGSPDAWPAEERTAMLSSIARSAQLQKLQKEAERIDDALRNADTAAPDHGLIHSLSQQIIARLPDTKVQSDPQSAGLRARWWMPAFPVPRTAYALAAISGVAVLVLVLAMQLFTTSDITNTADTAAFENWIWEDVTGQSVSAAARPNDELDFMRLVELELDGA